MGLMSKDSQRLLSLSLRWSVCYVLRTAPKNPKKTVNDKTGSPTLNHVSRERGRQRLVIYRAYFERLLRIPKPTRDQLILELPCLEGFRTGEISTLRAIDVDIENGDIRVLDSKKHVYFTVPLDPTVANHIIKLDIQEGYLIQGRKHTGKGLEDCQIENIWKEWSLKSGLPVVLTPREGRAYFACVWHFVEHKSMFHLMNMLRHTNIRVTQRYLEPIVDYEDLKAEFYRGRMFPNVKNIEEESIQ